MNVREIHVMGRVIVSTLKALILVSVSLGIAFSLHKTCKHVRVSNISMKLNNAKEIHHLFMWEKICKFHQTPYSAPLRASSCSLSGQVSDIDFLQDNLCPT